MINQIGMNSLARAPFQFKNLWTFSIIEASVSTQVITENIEGLVPVFLTRNVTLPFFKLETERKNSGRIVYNKVSQVEPFSITFLELETLPVLGFLKDWMERIYDPMTNTFRTNLTNSPTKLGLLTLFDSHFSDIPTKVFIYEGLRITGIQDLEFNYTDADPVEITADFVCDRVYPLSEWVSSKIGINKLVNEVSNTINKTIQNLF